MSSKSRKKTTPKKPATPSHGSQPGAIATAPEHHKLTEVADELVKVPKDRSRLRFVLMILLLIFALIVFVIPGALRSAARHSDVPIAIRWQDPVDGTVELNYQELAAFKRQISSAFRVESPLFLFRLGIQDPNRPAEDEEAARLLILDRLAQHAGVRISDQDLAAHLRQLIDQAWGKDVSTFKRAEAAYGGSAYVEAGLRLALRAARYLELFGRVAQAADPAQIEKLWHERHEDLAFDYVELPVESVRADAEAELPDDTALEAWFDGLDEAARLAFQRPEQRAAELVSWKNGADASALLAAYPPEEETAPEELAQRYYDRVFFRRFERPDEPEEPAAQDEAQDEAQQENGGEASGQAEGEKPAEKPAEKPKGPYLSLDEVREAATAEAPVFFAMERWLLDLQGRAAEEGAQIDLAAEAAKLGLEYRKFDPRTRKQYEEEGFSPSLAILVFQGQPDTLAPRLQVDKEGFELLRVGSVVEPAVPQFAEIRDDVAEAWIDDRAGELALERLRTIRDGFAELDEPDEDEAEDATEAPTDTDGPAVRRQATAEAFQAAVTAAGLEVGRRDWLDKSSKPDDDPAKDQPSHVFFRSRAWDAVAPNEVVEPTLDGVRQRAYLPRLAGRREVPVSRMKATDFETLSASARFQSESALREEFSVERLRQRYGLWLQKDEAPTEDEEPAEG